MGKEKVTKVTTKDDVKKLLPMKSIRDTPNGAIFDALKS